MIKIKIKGLIQFANAKTNPAKAMYCHFFEKTKYNAVKLKNMNKFSEFAPITMKRFE